MTINVLPNPPLLCQHPGQVTASFISSDYVDLQQVVASSHPDVGHTQTWPFLNDYAFEVCALSAKDQSSQLDEDQVQQIAQLKCFANEEAATRRLNQVDLFNASAEVTAIRSRLKKSKPARLTHRVSVCVPVRHQPARTHRSRPVRSKSASSGSKSSSDSDGPAPTTSHLTHLSFRSAHEQATSSQEVCQ